MPNKTPIRTSIFILLFLIGFTAFGFWIVDTFLLSKSAPINSNLPQVQLKPFIPVKENGAYFFYCVPGEVEIQQDFAITPDINLKATTPCHYTAPNGTVQMLELILALESLDKNITTYIGKFSTENINHPDATIINTLLFYVGFESNRPLLIYIGHPEETDNSLFKQEAILGEAISNLYSTSDFEAFSQGDFSSLANKPLLPNTIIYDALYDHAVEE